MRTILSTILIFTLNFVQAQNNFNFSINAGVTGIFKPYAIHNSNDTIYSLSFTRPDVIKTKPGLYVNTDLLMTISNNNEIGVQFSYQKFSQYIKRFRRWPVDIGPDGAIFGSHNFADLSVHNIGAGVVYRRHIGSKWNALISASLSFPLSINTGYEYYASRDTIEGRIEFDSKIRYHSDIALEYTLLQSKSVKMKISSGVSVFLNNTVETYPYKDKLRNINPFLLIGLELK